MGRISLIDKKLDKQNYGKNMISFDVYIGKLFNFNIFIMIQYSGSNEKIYGDTSSATLNRNSFTCINK